MADAPASNRANISIITYKTTFPPQKITRFQSVTQFPPLFLYVATFFTHFSFSFSFSFPFLFPSFRSSLSFLSFFPFLFPSSFYSSVSPFLSFLPFLPFLRSAFFFSFRRHPADFSASKSAEIILSALLDVFQDIEKCDLALYRTFRCTSFYSTSPPRWLSPLPHITAETDFTQRVSSKWRHLSGVFGLFS